MQIIPVWHVVDFYLQQLVHKQPNSRRANVIYNKLKKLVKQDRIAQNELAGKQLWFVEHDKQWGTH